MGRLIILVVALAALWLLLSGYFDKALLLAFGIGSVAFTAWISFRAGVVDDEGVPLSIFPGIIGYMTWLTVEVGKANIMVARQALAVEPKLSPKLFKVPNPPRSSVGKAIFGNSITLTPGTVTVDLRENEILVHALTEDLADMDGIADMGARRCAHRRKGRCFMMFAVATVAVVIAMVLAIIRAIAGPSLYDRCVGWQFLRDKNGSANWLDGFFNGPTGFSGYRTPLCVD